MRDPVLDIDFEHKEDEILRKLCDKFYILQCIDDMYGKTIINLAREKIRKWKQELGDLKAALKWINKRYSRAVFMMLCSVK